MIFHFLLNKSPVIMKHDYRARFSLLFEMMHHYATGDRDIQALRPARHMNLHLTVHKIKQFTAHTAAFIAEDDK